jgi:hypothetical protein
MARLVEPPPIGWEGKKSIQAPPKKSKLKNEKKTSQK